MKISEGRYCSRTLAVYWITRCVKGFLSFKPVAFTHVPPDVTTSKLCEELMFGNSVWHCTYKKLGFILMKKLATFGYIVEVSLPLKFNFYFWEF